MEQGEEALGEAELCPHLLVAWVAWAASENKDLLACWFPMTPGTGAESSIGWQLCIFTV